MTVRLHFLASGSAGNSLLVEAGETKLLIDAGLSGAEVTRRLERVGCRPDELKGILLSHEHTDHVQGVGVLARRHHLPVFATAGTFEACNGRLGDLPRRDFFQPGRDLALGDLTVRPFPIPHDAAEPVGFVLHHRRCKVGVATDMGFGTALAAQHLAACRLLVLEFNHDPELLTAGPYPWDLKQRIRGRLGHLSNAEATRLLERVLHHGLQEVVLAHISEQNNRPELARQEASRVLDRFRLGARVHVASQEGILSLEAPVA